MTAEKLCYIDPVLGTLDVKPVTDPSMTAIEIRGPSDCAEALLRDMERVHKENGELRAMQQRLIKADFALYLKVSG